MWCHSVHSLEWTENTHRLGGQMTQRTCGGQWLGEKIMKLLMLSQRRAKWEDFPDGEGGNMYMREEKKKLHLNHIQSDRQPSRGVLPLLWLIFLSNSPNLWTTPDSGFFPPDLPKNKRKPLLLSKTRKKKALLEWDVNDNPKIREIGNCHF